jgi:LPPG:FO 2-phospho-L-lactate transferase
MTDSSVSITAHTSEGKLTLEDYLWRRRAAPQIHRFEYEGFEQAEQNRDILRAIRLADVIIFAPTNPLLTLNPILSLPGLARLIGAASAPKIAVSPIVNGRDLQGNLDKMMAELGLEVSPFGVAEHIKEVLTGFVLDINDQVHQLRIYNLGLETLVTNTIINQADDEVRLANEILDFGESLR